MWKNKNDKAKKAIVQIISTFFIMQFCPMDIAQEESLSAPLPGCVPSNANVKVQESSQNVQNVQNMQPVAITTESDKTENDKEKSIFIIGMSSDKYPISINGLRALVEKYKQEASPTDANASELDLTVAWLDCIMRAHNRLANAFAKQSDLKLAYENECSLIRQLRGIKNEILYIKAQELIKGKKLKQAIPLLIDISCSEPNSALGLKAYQHLKQSGFSSANNLPLSKQADNLKAEKAE